ncbi:MAG: IclR family transcriptional regulator [Bacillota bacterium]|jgi:DNA-binding IclR family transcriptional regulator
MVQAVKKAVDVLLAVSESGGPVSLTEVASKAELPIATARRLLFTLADTSLIRREGKAYTLGIRAFEIGKKAEENIDLITLARPHLRKLADLTGENANLAVLDGCDVVYLACEECSKMVRVFTVTGARVPAHATGVGKVLLSGLTDAAIEELYEGNSLVRFTSRTVSSVQQLLAEVRKARERGWAVDEGEREDGVLCVAARVKDYFGRVVAAVSISGPSVRLGRRRVESEKRTIECAEHISRHLGWRA